ncbi:MAG: class I SAM-dependent methyltransferase [Cyanobacteriota bacterium]|nr:class I SAM-dependent methyltransferase [Cyanobacteriota bacterium]
MNEYLFRQDIDFLKNHYSKLLERHGDSPEGVQWSDSQTQERRMDILAQIDNLSSAKILDFGCGTGKLLSFLQEKREFNGEYVGYDISSLMIDKAKKKFPRHRFECRDIFTDGVPEFFDYVLISGVFNNLVDRNWELMTALLNLLFCHTKRGLAFNALSTYVDYCDTGLFYVNPEKIFRFCKETLSPCVTLRHDYLIRPNVVPFEFTIYVFQTELESRKNLEF